MTLGPIKKLMDLANGAVARADAQHVEFLDFYEALVTSAGGAVSKSFGKVSVWVKGEDKPREWGLLLTVGDLMFWREAILKDGVRFHNGVSSVKRAIYNRLGDLSEAHDMTPEERSEFVRVLKSSERAA